MKMQFLQWLLSSVTRATLAIHVRRVCAEQSNDVLENVLRKIR